MVLGIIGVAIGLGLGIELIRRIRGTVSSWSELILRHREFLRKQVEPDFGLVDKLYANEVLSDEEKADICAENTVYRRNSKLLQNIQARGQYDRFIEALRSSNQKHVVSYLEKNGNLTTDDDDWPLSDRERSILRENHEILVEILDVKDLVIRLHSAGVINPRQMNFISAKQTPDEKNKAFLDILSRRSIRDYKKTIRCLHESKQSHIAKILEGGGEYAVSDPNQKVISIIQTSASKDDGSAIYGLTVLDNELYLVTCSSSKVEVFDLSQDPPFCLKRTIIPPKLSNPYDITSCNKNICLYICHKVPKRKGKQAFISRHDTEGKHQNHWKIDDTGFLSVTPSQNILLTLRESKAFIEYKPNGDKIRLVNVELPCPIHVMSYSEDKFIVCYSEETDNPGGVCIGNVSRNDASSSSEDYMFSLDTEIHCNDVPSPMHMAMWGDGRILVADPFENRIILLDSKLKSIRDLVTAEYGLKFPYKLHFDGTSRRLFVVENESDCKDSISNGRVLVFDLSDEFDHSNDHNP